MLGRYQSSIHHYRFCCLDVVDITRVRREKRSWGVILLQDQEVLRPRTQAACLCLSREMWIGCQPKPADRTQSWPRKEVATTLTLEFWVRKLKLELLHGRLANYGRSHWASVWSSIRT